MTQINGVGGIKFDKTITLGNVLQVVIIVLAGFAAYLSIEIRIGIIDNRTADYVAIRDLAQKSDQRLTAQQAIIDQLIIDERRLTTILGEIKAEQAAHTATLKIIVDAVRTSRP